jgi:DNA-binding response OmpR family regulator
MRESILLVEDEQALQMVVGDRLRKDGYLVDCASDGDTGFWKATSQPFDLVILDIMMPRRSGLDLCRGMRRVGLETPVLILTAGRETEDVIAGFEAGADAYVTKPFDMKELSARVEALLRRTSAGGLNSQKDASLPTNSRRRSAALESGAVGGQSLSQPPKAMRERHLREARGDRFVASGNSSQFVEIVPRLRTMLNEERQSPQTPCSATLLHVAEDVIEFLEEILEDARSWRRAGPRDS